MDVDNVIRMSDADHRMLSDLLDRLAPDRRAQTNGLDEELDRAEILSDEAMPKDVVTLYSTVVYEDLDTGRVMMVQVTLPEDADLEQGRVSVLAPVGAALLGLGVGDAISWPLPDGRMGRLRVKQLIQQPRR
jgi:regulator of nucleoside diphosphate kinase